MVMVTVSVCKRRLMQSDESPEHKTLYRTATSYGQLIGIVGEFPAESSRYAHGYGQGGASLAITRNRTL